MRSGDVGGHEKPRRPPLIRVNVLDRGGFGRPVMERRGLGWADEGVIANGAEGWRLADL